MKRVTFETISINMENQISVLIFTNKEINEENPFLNNHTYMIIFGK